MSDGELPERVAELADVPRSRVFRQVVAMEVVAMVAPGTHIPASRDLCAGVDVEAMVRDAVQSNDHRTKGVWLQAGESAWSAPEELTP